MTRARPWRRLALLLGSVLTGLTGVLAFAGYRWRARSASLIESLRRGGDGGPAVFSETGLEGLPDAVARYFRAVMQDGQPLVRRAVFSQRGEFLLKPEKDTWGPFRAVQHVATRPAGFVWDARIRIAPGISVSVRDSFVEGTGSMFGSVLGLIPIMAVEGTPEIAEGALHRYLAESVWFPTALLPACGAVWTPLDGSSARATLGVAGTTVSVDFRFSEDGLVKEVFTAARARLVDGQALPTPWRGRFFDYAERGGMRIPLKGEVEWLLPDGPQPYWRGWITDIAYE